MEKLLAIATLGQKTYGRWLFRRLLANMLALLGLTIIIAILVSALLIVGLMAAYFSMLQCGMTPALALAVVGLLGLAIILLVIGIAFYSLHRLRQLPCRLMKKSPLTSGAMGVLDAFTDGLKAE